MTYPGWWVVGVSVVGKDGTLGVVTRTATGAWLINITSKEGGSYVINPKPEFWRKTARRGRA